MRLLSIFLFLSNTLFLHPIVAQDYTLSPGEVETKKDRIKQIIPDFIGTLNLLADPTVDGLIDKRQTSVDLINDYFLGNDVMVYNDIENSRDKIPMMKIKDYLTHVNLTLSGNDKEAVTEFSIADDLKIHGPFLDVNNVFEDADYFFKAEIGRTLQCEWDTENEHNNTQTLDFYIRIPEGSNRLLIYSINKHKNNTHSFTSMKVEEKEFIGGEESVTSNEENNTSTTPSVLSRTYVVFKINPNIADVSVDGEDLYYVNNENVVINPGSRKFKIEAKGYKTEEFELNIKEGQTNKIELDLIKEFGTVQFVSGRRRKKTIEKDAVVRIDGVEVGKIPTNRITLQPGIHIATFEKEGLTKGRKKVEVSAQSNEVVEVRLLKKENINKAVGTGIGILNSILTGGEDE